MKRGLRLLYSSKHTERKERLFFQMTCEVLRPLTGTDLQQDFFRSIISVLGDILTYTTVRRNQNTQHQNAWARSNFLESIASSKSEKILWTMLVKMWKLLGSISNILYTVSMSVYVRMFSACTRFELIAATFAHLYVECASGTVVGMVAVAVGRDWYSMESSNHR